MSASDANFSGSMAEIYDRHLGPFLFAPYARDLATRIAALQPIRVLEIAAGTGILTEALAALLGEAEIVATDLNPGMIAVGKRRVARGNLTWMQADAMALPFADASFDLAVCQFGVMFFPDMEASFREVVRVLRPGGRYAFNVWRGIEHNDAARLMTETVEAAFPEDPPRFIRRMPHGHDVPELIVERLRAAGFAQADVVEVRDRSRAASWADVIPGFTHGTPLRAEIESRDASRLDAISQAATDAGTAAFGNPVDLAVSANVFVARTPAA